MLDKEQFEMIRKVLPVLQEAEPQLTREFQEIAYFAKIPSGRDIFVEGDEVDAIALLLSGAVRVYRIGASGREITLYRFGGGESCILTANAILNHQAFPAIASVEQEAEAVMIPASTFHDWIGRFDAWRDFVFNLFSQRLVSVMEIVDQVAFQRMDRRIAAMLISQANQKERIQITHQAIADELGSSREVITRLLQDLAQQEIIRLSRGEIEIVDRAALKTIQTL